MPTKLEDLAASELTFRYQAPLISSEMNKRAVVNTPHGIYQGFRLGTHASALTVTVQGDVDALDHVAVAQTLDGFGLTVRRTGGDFALDLTAFVSKTVVLAVWVEYQTGITTVGEIRAYELLPADEFTGAGEKAELVVLGQVVVPASGVIAAASITSEYRTPAWKKEATERLDPVPIVLDPAFAFPNTGITLVGSKEGKTWDASGDDVWRVIQSFADSKIGAHYLSLTAPGTGTYTGLFSTPTGVPVEPTQYVYYRVWVRQTTVLVSGTIQLEFNFSDDEMVSITQLSVTLLDSSSGVDADYRLIEGGVDVPSGQYVLKDMRVKATAVNYAASGAKCRIGMVQVYVEPSAAQRQTPAFFAKAVVPAIQLVDVDTTGMIATESVYIDWDESDGLRIRRGDLDTAVVQPPVILPGRLDVGALIPTGAAFADLPRLVVNPDQNETFTLLFESDDGQGTGKIRSYIGADGVHPVHFTTRNALFTNTSGLWSRDAVGSASFQYGYIGGVYRMRYHSTGGAATWLDSAWQNEAFTLEALGTRTELKLSKGLLSILNASTTTSNLPRVTPPIENTLYAKNMPKVWGNVTVAANVVTSQSGFNYTATIDGTGHLIITYHTPFITENALTATCVIATSNGVADEGVTVFSHGLTSCALRLFSGGVFVDLTTGSGVVNFVVYGPQGDSA